MYYLYLKVMNNGYLHEFTPEGVIEKMNQLDEQLIEEQEKDFDKRNREREFELMYAKFMAGLKLNTGVRIF